MTAFRGAIRFQLWSVRAGRDELLLFIMAPIFTVLLVSLTRSSGRDDLIASAALGAVLISLWNLSVQVGGNIIDSERSQGTMDLVIAAPPALRTVVLGKVAATTLISLGLVPEVWLVTWLLYDYPIRVPHPGLFVTALTLTMGGLAVATYLVAALFVYARTAFYYQIAFTYPFLLLGGVIVPVAEFPEWLEYPARLVFLSWAADLLRASLAPGPPPATGTSLVGLCLTTAVTFAVAWWLLAKVVERARYDGSVSAI